MTRIPRIRPSVVVLAAAFGLAAWSADVLAQAPPPAAPQPQLQAAGGSIVEGKIAHVSGVKVTLADGREVTLPSDLMKAQRADLKAGATIRVSFEERGGQQVVTGIAVETAR